MELSLLAWLGVIVNVEPESEDSLRVELALENSTNPEERETQAEEASAGEVWATTKVADKSSTKATVAERQGVGEVFRADI